MKIGVAISVYDKYDFVLDNLRVFKSIWSSHPQVCICCNHAPTFKKLKKIENNFINIVLGEDYPVNSKKDLRRRQHDCIKKSVSFIANKSDYVIHWHADAFALDEKEILKIIDEMKDNNYLFSGRGFWKNYISLKVPQGDVDDHFFIFKSTHVKKSELFSNKFSDFVNHLINNNVCSEGILGSLVSQTTLEENILIYSNMSECEVLKSDKTDNRYPDNVCHRTLPPVNFDPIRKFLHCDMKEKLKIYFEKCNIDYDRLKEVKI